MAHLGKHRLAGALLVCAAVLLAGSVSEAAPGDPIGPQFQVNSFTPSYQWSPSVGPDGAGGFVVVWESFGSAGTDTSAYSIQGQRFDPDGTFTGSQFQVNTFTPNVQRLAATASNGGGGFVVTWQGGGDGSGYGIRGQNFDILGAPAGLEFQANTYTTSSQSRAAVAPDGAGGFVVVWESYGGIGTDPFGPSIQAQRFDAGGSPTGVQFQVNSYTPSSQRFPAVGSDGASGFVVVWGSNGSSGSDTSGYSVQGQRFDATGAPAGSEFQVNAYTTGSQSEPAIGPDGAGGFVVLWNSVGSDGTDTDSVSVHGQRFDATGVPVGTEFQVNTFTTGIQADPDVAPDGVGGFVVVWQSAGSSGTDTSGSSIQAQRFDATGAPAGGEFQVNNHTIGIQREPSVAPDGLGGFVVAWQSASSPGSDISADSIQARRFEGFTVSTTSSSSTSTSSTSTTSSSTLPTTDLLSGRILLVRNATLAKFVAKPGVGDTLMLPIANPVTTGGALRIFDVGASAGDDTYGLAAGVGWKGLGNPAGSKGYKYKGAGTPSDPCKVVLVKETVVKAVCKGSGITLVPPFSGDTGIVLSFGTTDRYCAQFGGDEVKNDATLTKRKNAPAPGACPP